MTFSQYECDLHKTDDVGIHVIACSTDVCVMILFKINMLTNTIYVNQLHLFNIPMDLWKLRSYEYLLKAHDTQLMVVKRYLVRILECLTIDKTYQFGCLPPKRFSEVFTAKCLFLQMSIGCNSLLTSSSHCNCHFPHHFPNIYHTFLQCI